MIINDKPRHYTGLSTDTKPNLGYSGNGYVFLESDSGLEYVYSAKIGTWLPLSEPGDAPCVGVLKIEKTSSEGLIDTYTIYYTNGAQTTYQVTNGEHGEKGDQGDAGLTPYIGENLNWWIGDEDTGVYAKGSDEKYNLIKEGGRITVNLLHNNAFICKNDLNALTIVFPGNVTFPDDDSIVPGWISEITFKGSVSQDFVFLENVDTSKIKYYKFGRLRTGIHFETNSTINLIFQYDGLNVYCYITEISDDVAVD